MVSNKTLLSNPSRCKTNWVTITSSISLYRYHVVCVLPKSSQHTRTITSSISLYRYHVGFVLPKSSRHTRAITSSISLYRYHVGYVLPKSSRHTRTITSSISRYRYRVVYFLPKSSQNTRPWGFLLWVYFVSTDFDLYSAWVSVVLNTCCIGLHYNCTSLLRKYPHGHTIIHN